MCMCIINKNMLVSQLKIELTKLTREIMEENGKAIEIDDGKCEFATNY